MHYELMFIVRKHKFMHRKLMFTAREQNYSQHGFFFPKNEKYLAFSFVFYSICTTFAA